MKQTCFVTIKHLYVIKVFVPHGKFKLRMIDVVVTEPQFITFVAEMN